MQHVLKNSAPSTYFIKFFDTPDRFTITDERGKTYYYRYFPDGAKVIKVNIPHKGNYYFNCNCEIKRVPIQIVDEIGRVKLPPPERNREKEFFFTYDHNETDSPALIYTQTGQIILGRKFLTLPQPMKEFICLHEIGHFKYKTEKYCDLYAFVHFVRMGNNPSNAMYCLTDILRRNPANDERIGFLFDTMVNAEIVK